MGPHSSQRVTLVPADGTPVRLHPAVRFHVFLSGVRGGTDNFTARAFVPQPGPGRCRGRTLVPRFHNSPAPPASSRRLHFVPLQAIKCLVRVQVIQRREFYTACHAYELLVLPGRAGASRCARAHRRARRLQRVLVLHPRGAVMFLVDHVVLVLAEHNVAFLALGDALLHEDLRRGGERWKLTGVQSELKLGREQRQRSRAAASGGEQRAAR